jgi:hypothetical protein
MKNLNRPKDGLYHFQTGFPKIFNSNIGTIDLQYSTHAQDAARSDRYGQVWLPKSIDTSKAQCIEIQYKSGYVNKLVYRVSYTAHLDLCLVCFIAGNRLLVATVWLNSRQDKHKTLDRSKYIKVA